MDAKEEEDSIDILFSKPCISAGAYFDSGGFYDNAFAKILQRNVDVKNEERLPENKIVRFHTIEPYKQAGEVI